MSKLLKQHNSVIKHIINLPLPNSFPLCRAKPGEAPLSKRDKLTPFIHPKLHFSLILSMGLMFIRSGGCMLGIKTLTKQNTFGESKPN